MVRVFWSESILCQPGSRGMARAGVSRVQGTPAEVSPPGSPRPRTSKGGTAFSHTPGHSSKDQLLTNSFLISS